MDLGYYHCRHQNLKKKVRKSKEDLEGAIRPIHQNKTQFL